MALRKTSSYVWKATSRLCSNVERENDPASPKDVSVYFIPRVHPKVLTELKIRVRVKRRKLCSGKVADCDSFNVPKALNK